MHRSERRWIQFSIGLLVVFAIAIAISSVSLGIRLPGVESRALEAAEAAGFPPDEPWIRELAPLRYEVNLFANAFFYEPDNIEIPVGSTVTFLVHSNDVIHGFKIAGTNVTMMAIPGQIGRVSHTFDSPGEYLIICNEYCGVGHHAMSGKIIVHE